MTLLQASSIFTFIWLVLLMIQMGLTVTLPEVISSLRDTGLMAKALIGNFLVVPAIVAAFLWGFHEKSMVSAGLLTLVVFAGAPFGPQFSMLAKGDVPLSVGLMLLLTLLSVVISPAILAVLLHHVSHTDHMTVRYDIILKTLLMVQVIPLVTGLLIRHFAPGFTLRITRPVRILTLILMVIACTLVSVAEYPVFFGFGPRAWIGSGLVFLCTLGIGWLIGGKDLNQRKTVALTTTVRNAAVAMVIGLSNFAGTVALAAILVYTVFSTTGSLVASLLLRKMK